MKLVQRRFLFVRELEIVNYHLKITRSDLTDKITEYFPLSEFDTKHITYTKDKPGFLIILLTVISGVVFASNFFELIDPTEDEATWFMVLGPFLLFSAMSLLTYLGFENLLLIPNRIHGQIELFRNRPSDKEVDEFIALMERQISKFDIPVED
jgi:hypothetical protein